ncbi:MAG: Ig-like domain-containing protein [Spirochaetaceae bacterium]|jgi:uncharacterized protein YfaS (alpha-2-macroglobulin family)|nr:Ig-like domain-containing protein [Spirochaetaceae bacterium]
MVLYKKGIILLLVSFFVSCKEEAPKEQIDIVPVPETSYIKEAEKPGMGMLSLANDEAVAAAFNLDYRPQYPPEEKPETKALPMPLQTTPQTSTAPQILDSPLRPLSDYVIDYELQSDTLAAGLTTIDNDDFEKNRTRSPVTISDWGPQGTVADIVDRPQIYIIFSQPMSALSTLNVRESSSALVNIQPPVEGTFMWSGSSFLVFQASESFKAGTNYTININPAVKSLYGNTFAGNTSLRFNTAPLAISKIEAGIAFKKDTGMWFNDTNVPPEAAKEISIDFNYPVNTAELYSNLKITQGRNSNLNYTLEQSDEDTVIAHVTDAINFNTSVTVRLSSNATGYSFSTPGLFLVNKLACEESYDNSSMDVDIKFSARLNTESFTNQISITEQGGKSISIGKDNQQVYYDSVRLTKLPLEYGKSYTVIVNANVQDVYGRNLGKTYRGSFAMPKEAKPFGSASFPDSGNNIMEAVITGMPNYTPRTIFEYTNIIEPSSYYIKSFDAPNALIQENKIDLEASSDNKPHFEEIDLNPYLNEYGRGSVYFNANLTFPQKQTRYIMISDDSGSSSSQEEEVQASISNTMRLQVSDLALTVRYAFNKTTALVSRISTGEPVEGAVVSLLRPAPFFDDEGRTKTDWVVNDSNSFGQAMSDKNGLAVIVTETGLLRDATLTGEDYRTEPWVSAEKEGDRVVYRPGSHNAWAFGVGFRQPQTAEEVKPVVFLFSDRGIYKPGETISFRGVDRSLVLGMYLVYKGNYSIVLEEDSWQGQEIQTISGSLSDSGGFNGTISLPETIPPGNYRLSYRRENTTTVAGSTQIQVSYFERRKFEANFQTPQSPLYSGDTITEKLTASYMSGGPLNDAAYNAAWYRESSWFIPPAAPDGYIYGPRTEENADARKNLSTEEGKLNSSGEADFSQRTGDEEVIGMPYSYILQSNITDLSGQMIEASSKVLIHPASFYIGLSRKTGFAKAGEEQEHIFTVQNVDGSIYKPQNPKKMSIELLREEWKRVQQPGVGGYVYDRYTREYISDYKTEINYTGNANNSFKLKPSKPGFYIIRLSMQDDAGRTALSEGTFYCTGSNASRWWNQSRAEELNLVSDKPLYNPGDKAQVLLQTPLPKGWYLITVEREGIYTEEVRYFDQAMNVIEIPIARNFVPLVYVSIASYSTRSSPPKHQYGEADVDKPKGYYGLIALAVNPHVRSFTVDLKLDKETYAPGETVNIELFTNKNGEAIANTELTLMAVDRGVVDVIDYHVPNPIDFFYDRSNFPLMAGGGDSRSWLVDPVTYRVKNLMGGAGATAEDSKIDERSDFNPTAVFLPAITTDEKGRAVASFTLPDSLTKYRLTAFAYKGDSFGLTEEEFTVTQPLTVQAVLPRRLRERDTGSVGVLLNNLDTKEHTITVQLETMDNICVVDSQDAKENMFSKMLTMPAGNTAAVYFDVAALHAGRETLRWTITSDVLNEALIVPLIVDANILKETSGISGFLDTDVNTITEPVILPSVTKLDEASLGIQLDAAGLSLVQDAFDYLIHYPYGCLEQRSGAVMSLLLLNDMSAILGMRTDIEDIPNTINLALSSWADMQLPTGGFPYWPSSSNADYYVTLRIAETVRTAQEKGFIIPPSLNIEKMFEYISKEYNTQNNYLKAYSLYIESIYNKEYLPDNLQALLPVENPIVLSFAGMAALNSNNTVSAEIAETNLKKLIRISPTGADLSGADVGANYYYGGKTEQLATSLAFLVRRNTDSALERRLLNSLIARKTTGKGWDNTAVSIRALQAICAYIAEDNLENTDINATVTLADTELLQGSFLGLNSNSLEQIYDLFLPPLLSFQNEQSNTTLPLTITKNGVGGLFYRATLSNSLPYELQTYTEQGIGVNYSIYNNNTNELITNNTFTAGVLYRIEAKVYSPMDRTYVALRLPVPSGAEVLEANTEKEERSKNQFDYTRTMDNEVQYFWDRFKRGEAGVSLLFRAVRRGVYPTPPAYVECMYEAETFGRSNGALCIID